MEPNNDELNPFDLFPEDEDLRVTDPNELTDEKLDRILTRMTHLQAEKEAISAQTKRRIAAIDSKLAGIQFMHGARIQEKFVKDLAKKGKTKFVDYAIARVKNVLSGRGLKVQRADDLMEWAKDSNVIGLVQTVESIDQLTLKAMIGMRFAVQENGTIVDTEVGEVIPGIEWSEGNDQTSIELQVPKGDGTTKTVSIKVFNPKDVTEEAEHGKES
jgi:phage host-nuclease inhibitor protein Gam